MLCSFYHIWSLRHVLFLFYTNISCQLYIQFIVDYMFGKRVFWNKLANRWTGKQDYHSCQNNIDRYTLYNSVCWSYSLSQQLKILFHLCELHQDLWKFVPLPNSPKRKVPSNDALSAVQSISCWLQGFLCFCVDCIVLRRKTWGDQLGHGHGGSPQSGCRPGGSQCGNYYRATFGRFTT